LRQVLGNPVRTRDEPAAKGILSPIGCEQCDWDQGILRQLQALATALLVAPQLCSAKELLDFGPDLLQIPGSPGQRDR
jgi:hypothetical protein